MAIDAPGEIENLFRPQVLVTGVNHRTADVSLREKLAIDRSRADEILESLIALPDCDEAVVISTCNRTEFITSVKSNTGDSTVALDSPIDLAKKSAITKIFSEISGLSPAKLENLTYSLSQRSAVGHIFRVASGLDSAVIGEPQILGQMKEAYRLAKEKGTTGIVLNRLFDRAFGIAKRVRTDTEIGRHAVSVAFAAREVAEQIFGSLQSCSLMLLGAGEMGELALKHFKRSGISEIYVVNKTLARGCALAEEYGAVPLSFAQMGKFLETVDIVVGACLLPNNSDPLILAKSVSKIARKRGGRPQFFVDLAVPRNLEPAINDVDDTYLYNIDDLGALVQRNLAGRHEEAERAGLIVDEEVERFWSWLSRRHIEMAFAELASRLEGVCAEESGKTLKRIVRTKSSLTEIEAEGVEHALRDFASAILSKTLHGPLVTAKERAVDDPAVLELFRAMFLRERE